MLSILVPAFNEETNLPILYERIIEVLEPLGTDFEVIIVDDGSSDGTAAVLDELATRDSRIKAIVFRRNFGQTAALMAAIDHSSGDVLVPLDADLQNDPADIPRLIAKLDEGFDVVSGWRKNRQDHAVRRNLPSRIANLLISTISGVRLHDYGCTLKAYRRSVLAPVRLYGEMHRFIPIYATWTGGRVTEIPVSHHPRKFGRSKYGMERILKVILDLIVVQFLGKYETKPIYVFGGFGFLSLVISFISGVYALWLKFSGQADFVQTPLPLLVVLTFLTGMMSILMGLLAEIVMRVYFESQGKAPYLVRSRRNLASGDTATEIESKSPSCAESRVS
jgi:glycosyltransferase involved in cell wall biosynthesis